MPYANLTTVSALKSWFRNTGPNDDGVLGTLIRDASEQIGRFCGRPNLGSIESYTEDLVGTSTSNLQTGRSWNWVLRYYPVKEITSVIMGNVPMTILSSNDLQVGTAGVYLINDDEPRILKFFGLRKVFPIQITYKAGYAPGSIPPPLQQVAAEYATEIFKQASHVGLKSVAIAGETTSFDLGSDWAMSDKLMAKLQPYRNVNPFMGFG